jgi:hypothetical protein
MSSKQAQGAALPGVTRGALTGLKGPHCCSDDRGAGALARAGDDAAAHELPFMVQGVPMTHDDSEENAARGGIPW